MVASCEGDMDSAVTMLLMKGLTDTRLWMANPGRSGWDGKLLPLHRAHLLYGPGPCLCAAQPP